METNKRKAPKCLLFLFFTMCLFGIFGSHVLGSTFDKIMITEDQNRGSLDRIEKEIQQEKKRLKKKRAREERERKAIEAKKDRVERSKFHKGLYDKYETKLLCDNIEKKSQKMKAVLEQVSENDMSHSDAVNLLVEIIFFLKRYDSSFYDDGMLFFPDSEDVYGIQTRYEYLNTINFESEEIENIIKTIDSDIPQFDIKTRIINMKWERNRIKVSLELFETVTEKCYEQMEKIQAILNDQDPTLKKTRECLDVRYKSKKDKIVSGLKSYLRRYYPETYKMYVPAGRKSPDTGRKTTSSGRRRRRDDPRIYETGTSSVKDVESYLKTIQPTNEEIYLLEWMLYSKTLFDFQVNEKQTFCGSGNELPDFQLIDNSWIQDLNEYQGTMGVAVSEFLKLHDNRVLDIVHVELPSEEEIRDKLYRYNFDVYHIPEWSPVIERRRVSLYGYHDTSKPNFQYAIDRYIVGENHNSEGFILNPQKSTADTWYINYLIDKYLTEIYDTNNVNCKVTQLGEAEKQRRIAEKKKQIEMAEAERQRRIAQEQEAVVDQSNSYPEYREIKKDTMEGKKVTCPCCSGDGRGTCTACDYFDGGGMGKLCIHGPDTRCPLCWGEGKVSQAKAQQYRRK